MTLLKKLLKFLAVLAVIVVVVLLVFIWPVLGVNPFEGRQAHLWELVDNQVDFFVRFPGTQVLDEPLARSLEERRGYAWIQETRATLADLTRDIAQQVNPQIPGGLFEVDFNEDILGKEMALAGSMRTDFTQLKFDNFIFLTRIPFYARFVSALKRSFVRGQLPDGDRITVEKGYYLKIKLDEETARQVSKFRTLRPGATPADTLYVGRIRDVLLVSDEPDWIEAALRGRSETLPADPWFETEFIGKAREGRNIEFFMRPYLSANLLNRHGSEETGGALAPLKHFIPVQMAGEVTILATPQEDGISVELSDNPPPSGYDKVVKAHLQHLYEREKGDLLFDFSENGIGRFVPRKRTVGAVVIHMDAAELAGLILDFLPTEERRLLDEEVRRGGYRRGLDTLLRNELMAELGDIHLLVLHRPAEFEGMPYATLRPTERDPMYKQEYSLSLVSKVRDSASAAKVIDTITRHLQYIRLVKTGKHKSLDLHLTKKMDDAGDFRLIQPAFGILPGSKFIVFSSHHDAAEALFEAAADESQRLIHEPGVEAALARLPRLGTIGMILRGEVLRQTVWDGVREYADLALDTNGFYARKRAEYNAQGFKNDTPELEDRLAADAETYIAQQYPVIRERYEEGIAWLDAIDTIAATCTLGIGPTKQVRAKAYLKFDVAPLPEYGEDDDEGTDEEEGGE